MIRVHRRQEEPKEPKFGESRAAPLQGADSGRPSGSSQVRGMGQERRMGPGGAHLNDDYGSSMFMQNRKSLEVPYSVTSSEGRYDRTGQDKDARPKSSTEPISILASTSLKSGIFPSEWKKANVVPVFKKNDKSSVTNYRPISLLPCPSKVIERLVFNELYDYCDKFKLLSEKNSGFKKNDGTINQLINPTNKILSGARR